MKAKDFVRELTTHKSADEKKNIARFYQGPAGNKCMGVRMGTIFKIAKAYTDLALDQIEVLLESPYYEVRMGGVSIMDFRARKKKTTEAEHEALFDLYLRRHDRINNWDLVDRSAPHVLGGYLIDKERDVLYELAASEDVWERRSAIVSTWFSIKNDDLDETFGIAEELVEDENEYVHKAVGSWIREAGKRDEARLCAFLDDYAAVMPRAGLRYAVEKLGKAKKARYMAAGRKS